MSYLGPWFWTTFCVYWNFCLLQREMLHKSSWLNKIDGYANTHTYNMYTYNIYTYNM